MPPLQGNFRCGQARQACRIPCSPTKARCRTIRACRSWSTAARSISPVRPIQRTRSIGLFARRYVLGDLWRNGIFPMYVRLSISMSHEGLGVARLPRQVCACLRRISGSKNSTWPRSDIAVLPAGTRPIDRLWASPDLLVTSAPSQLRPLRSLPQQQGGARQGAADDTQAPLPDETITAFGEACRCSRHWRS